MSADLFAAFDGPPPGAADQRQSNNSTRPAPPVFDPLPYLNPALQTPNPQQAQPWPSLQSSNYEPWGGISGGQGSDEASKNTLSDDEDGWGDFETAEPSPKPTRPVTNPLPSPSFTKPAPQNPAVQRTRILRAPTLELMTNSLIDLPGANALPDQVRSPPWMRQSFEQKPASISKQATQPPTLAVKPVKADPNVLFDADEFDGKDAGEDDDEFGDFETTISPVQTEPQHLISTDLFTTAPTARPHMTAKRMNTADMFSALILNQSISSYPQAPKSPSFQDRNPFPGLALSTPMEPRDSQHNDNPKTSPVTAWPATDKRSAGSNKLDDDGDDWGAFDDLPVEPEPKHSQLDDSGLAGWGNWDSTEPKKPDLSKPQVVTKAADEDVSSWAWDAAQTPVETSSQADTDQVFPINVPPINVPPPSLLLSIFPELFNQANDSLFKPISGQAFSIKNRILSDPKTIDSLRGYVALATVAARVIAGRKHRWHRDKFLSQSMSISAAGSKGMKLAGIDKTQAAREDREAGDILDLWKEHVGRLRSSVATANQSLKDALQHIKIPELRDNMQAQTAKGSLSAPKACIVCGLKRDERVARVDFDIEDSFGEWWTEHWGHTTCKRFWMKHESALRQR